MTIPEFLEELKKLEHKAILLANCIRFRDENEALQCPITAVCNKLHSTNCTGADWKDAGSRLGLTLKGSLDLIDAADSNFSIFSPSWEEGRNEELRKLRVELVKILGL